MMEGRKRPIDCTPDMPVLNRVVMDVIHMPLQITMIPNQVFPEAPLPDAAFTLIGAALGYRFPLRNPAGETALISISLSTHADRGSLAAFRVVCWASFVGPTYNYLEAGMVCEDRDGLHIVLAFDAHFHGCVPRSTHRYPNPRVALRTQFINSPIRRLTGLAQWSTNCDRVCLSAGSVFSNGSC